MKMFYTQDERYTLSFATRYHARQNARKNDEDEEKENQIQSLRVLKSPEHIPSDTQWVSVHRMCEWMIRYLLYQWFSQQRQNMKCTTHFLMRVGFAPFFFNLPQFKQRNDIVPYKSIAFRLCIHAFGSQHSLLAESISASLGSNFICITCKMARTFLHILSYVVSYKKKQKTQCFWKWMLKIFMGCCFCCCLFVFGIFISKGRMRKTNRKNVHRREIQYGNM